MQPQLHRLHTHTHLHTFPAGCYFLLSHVWPLAIRVKIFKSSSRGSSWICSYMCYLWSGQLVLKCGVFAPAKSPLDELDKAPSTSQQQLVGKRSTAAFPVPEPLLPCMLNKLGKRRAKTLEPGSPFSNLVHHSIWGGGGKQLNWTEREIKWGK